MKKRISKRIAQSLAFLLCLALLAGCAATVKGTYRASGDLLGLAGSSTTYTFDGSKVTLTTEASILGRTAMSEYKGSYTLDEKAGTITFTFEDTNAQNYAGTFPFEKNESFVVINGVTYKKV